MTISGEDQNYQAFIEGSKEENAKYWEKRTVESREDRKREHKGVYYLGLSLFSLLGGVVSVLYGLAGKDWIQKPYLILGCVLILVGLSIVIGGFGKVKS